MNDQTVSTLQQEINFLRHEVSQAEARRQNDLQFQQKRIASLEVEKAALALALVKVSQAIEGVPESQVCINAVRMINEALGVYYLAQPKKNIG